jgi:hypothetical protein
MHNGLLWWVLLMQGSFGEFIGKKVYLLRILHGWESLSTEVLSFAHQFPCIPFLPSLQVWRVDGPSRSGTYRWSRKVRASKPFQTYYVSIPLLYQALKIILWELNYRDFIFLHLHGLCHVAGSPLFHYLQQLSMSHFTWYVTTPFFYVVLLKERLWRLWKGWAIVWILNLTNISHILWYASSESRDPSEFQGFIRVCKSGHWSFLD